MLLNAAGLHRVRREMQMNFSSLVIEAIKTRLLVQGVKRDSQ